MTRVWTGATAAFAVACAAAVAAQTGGSQSDRDRTITVVGCLERGDQSPASTTGTSGTSTRPSSSARGEWILKNATMSPGGSSASTGSTTTTGTAGTTGTSSATEAGSGSTYILLGKSDELSKHAGHKIEVTGKLDSSSSSASTGSTSGTTGSTTSATTGSTSSYGSSSSSMDGGKKLHVDSIKMISADCSSK